MIEKKYFERASAEIDDLFNKIDHPDSNLKHIPDGIIDIEKYFTAKYRIMWVLKEPYDSFNEDGSPTGGGWDFRDILSEKNSDSDLRGRSRRMYINILYTTWGILNGVSKLEQIPKLKDNPEILDAFKSLSYININKFPARKGSTYQEIQDAYDKDKRDKGIVLKQLKNLKPNIIIAGNTLKHFCEDFDFSYDQMVREPNVNHLIKDGVIFLDAWHPSYWIISQKDYCESVINAALKYLND